ncbi:MAG: hypothetical protein WDA22_01365 [Bacteroidota bacterium]
MKSRNIVFYFPYNKGAGGVNILFLKLANYFADHTDCNIYIGDFTDGYMYLNNRNSKIQALLISPNKKCEVPEDSVVIFQTISPWYIEEELQLKKGTRLLFWNLHPYNLLMYFKNYRRNVPAVYKIASPYVQHLIRKFASTAMEHHGLLFMDEENKKSAEMILHRIIPQENYLPVASDEAERHHFDSGKNIVWVGRIADFKISILLYIMRQLSQYALKHNRALQFHIIGDGPEAEQMHRSIPGCENEYFSVSLIGEIENAKIKEYLTERGNVLFAMGASALEGARLGIPTIILDFSYHPIGIDYRYRYLFETKDYTLGKDIDGEGFTTGEHSMEEILDELHDPQRYQTVSDRCYQYYKNHHDIASVSKKLLDYIDRTELRYQHIEPYRNNIVMRLFKARKKLFK